MSKPLFTENDRATIANFIGTGGAAGISLGLATALATRLRQLNEERKNDTSLDDDKLTIKLPAKSASDSSVIAPGLGMFGGALAGLLGFTGVRRVMKGVRKRELQRQVDQEQKAYLDLIAGTEKLRKGASRGRALTPGEVLGGGSLALLLAAGLASGVTTNRALNHAYPVAKKPKDLNPRRVVIRRRDLEPKEDEQEKEAALDLPVATAMDSMEFVTGLVLATPGIEKISSIPGLVYRVSRGGVSGVRSEVEQLGWDTACDTSIDVGPMTPLEKTCSVRLLLEDPVTGPGFSALAAAEFRAISPTFCKAAEILSDEEQDVLEKLAAGMALASREDLPQMEAGAEGHDDLAGALERLLNAEAA